MPHATVSARRRAALRCGAAALAAALAAVALAGCGSAPRQQFPTNRAPGSALPSAPPPPGSSVRARVDGAAELVANVRPGQVAPDAATPVAAAEQAFTVALLRQLGSDGSQNLTVSPASLALALSMLENGAAGRTRTEIAAALQASGLSLAEQNAGWRALVASWADAAKSDGFSLASANAVWMQRGFPVRKQFLDALIQNYGAGVWQTDFAQHMAESLQAIDDWCAQHTNGKITKLFDSLDPATVLVLADAVYFRAEWQTPFLSDRTSDAPFTTADGRTVRVPTMRSSELSAPAAVTPGYSAVQLPYRGGRFAALAIMPTGQSLGSFVTSLTPDRLAQITSSLIGGNVDLTMPRFTTTSTLDSLPEALHALGMHSAFGPGADFSALSPQAVSVGQVVQRDFLSVTEKGTEAAAVTGIGVVTSIAVPQRVVHLDHPFLFLVRDVKTGAVLFASEVMDPAGA
ncbi:MAG TPA: serpin family protein [Jatrophihabitans sp.]|nr:serpin family protein [Jatrophihabitans sp.]